MSKNKKIYDRYWKYTAAYTDLTGETATEALSTCVNYLNERGDKPYSQKDYAEMQRRVSELDDIDSVSARKAINQFVKLGFLKPLLAGYNNETIEFLNARDKDKRKSVLSKIVYKYANFDNSMTKPVASDSRQINFLIKTLEEVGKLTQKELIALMTVNTDDFPKGYLTAKELQDYYDKAEKNNFFKRKYNQVRHLRTLLNSLDNLTVRGTTIYFSGDDDNTEAEKVRKTRDPYLQSIFKSELCQESISHYNSVKAKCMVEKLSHPVLIASHIKPYSHCDENDDSQFDVNNGLLLSKNIDSLFDLGYITFEDDGSIKPSPTLDDDMKNYLSGHRLDNAFLNDKRLNYLEYHREKIFRSGNK
ncbi:MAG: HNH endonuclease [Muribaculaceae bacterium]|nr:HNH endonuclease [Muribaculaceae bacterium]